MTHQLEDRVVAVAAFARDTGNDVNRILHEQELIGNCVKSVDLATGRIEAVQAEHGQRLTRLKHGQDGIRKRLDGIERTQTAHSDRFDRIENLLTQIWNGIQGGDRAGPEPSSDPG